jgi:hypothetical protein
MSDTNHSSLATAMVALLERFVGNSPDALGQMRTQVEGELAGARRMVREREAQLAAIDQLQALLNEKPQEQDAGSDSAGATISITALTAPPLKKGIVQILDENPERIWDREALFLELRRRGWAPGGSNPKNTFTSRLRDLEKEQRLRRIGRHGFTSLKNEGALTM